MSTANEVLAPSGVGKTHFFPPHRKAWETVDPATLGINADALGDAIAFAEDSDCGWPQTMYTAQGEYVGTAYLQEQPPHNEVLGPVQPRGTAAGLVVRHGRIAAQWGDVRRPDMTFSVAKSYLAVLTGLAVQDGLIEDIRAPVRQTDRIGAELHQHFSGDHNGEITWEHLLQQTSEWSGTLWGKPDTIDANRQTDAGVDVDNSLKGSFRERHKPGAFWEYNDVRVNLLALCLLHVFRRPLQQVLADRIMIPIGASRSWNWLAYANAQSEIDDEMLPSVPGGGHWGGGLIINTLDHARFGYLILRRGEWDGRRVLQEQWIDRLAEPCPLNSNYGYMWWLNSEGNQCPAAPHACFFAAGAGGNIIWIDRLNDLVIVCRWMAKDKIGELLGKITRAVMP